MPATVKIGFVSPLIRATIATLQAKLPDQITEFNSEVANLIDLVNPVKYVFGADDPLGVDGFPVIEVAVTQGSGGDASVSLGQLGSDFDHFPVVTVVCWHEGATGELQTTYESSLGMARCVVECLLPAGGFGPDASPIRDEAGNLSLFWRTDAIPTDPTDDGRTFRKWRVPVLLQFTVQHVDHFEAA